MTVVHLWHSLIQGGEPTPQSPDKTLKQAIIW